jgi:uncharacterized protein
LKKPQSPKGRGFLEKLTMSYIIALIPAIVTAILLLFTSRTRPDAQRARVWLILITLLCIVADGLLLIFLPKLGLSFGAVRFSFFIFSFGQLCVLLVGLGALRLPIGPRQIQPIFILVCGLQVLLPLLAFYGLYIEPFNLTTTELKVDAPAFLPDRPLRILQISDLHIERETRRERDLLVRVKELQPDIIVLTGDYLNLDYLDDEQSRQDAHDLLAQLSAPYGIYAIIGTTDTQDMMRDVFSGLDIRVMDDEFTSVSLPENDLYIVGVTNGNSTRNGKRLTQLMANVPADAYTLLLYHTPDIIEEAAASGVDLYLAGHTHGGQVRLPLYGAIVTFSKFGKKYEMGKYVVGETTLYVSRGLGMEGWFLPRIRFLAPPEIVLIELGK